MLEVFTKIARKICFKEVELLDRLQEIHLNTSKILLKYHCVFYEQNILR